MTPTAALDPAARRQLLLGRLCVIGAALLWSLGGLAGKAIPLDGWSIAFYRGLFAGLALLPLVRRENVVFKPAMAPLMLSFALMCGLYLAAVKATTAANAIYLQCTGTFWMIPLGWWLLRESPDRRSVIGVGLAIVGVLYIVVMGRDDDPRSADTLGIVLGLCSGLAYAGVVVGLRRLRGLDPTWLSAVNNLGSGLLIGAWLLVSGAGIPVPPPLVLLALALFGIVQMAIPYVLMSRGLRVVPAAEAGLLALLEPALSPLWVWLALGETPKPATLVGGAFLLAGILARMLPAPKFRPKPVESRTLHPQPQDTAPPPLPSDPRA